VCGAVFCMDCQEVSHPGRVCDEGKKRDWVCVLQTTKPCPGCRVPVYKIDGCYQMWCTQCRTAVDWKTGFRIEGEEIHNPHFFEDASSRPLEWDAIETKISTPRRGVWKAFCLFIRQLNSTMVQDKVSCEELVRERREWRRSFLKRELSEEAWRDLLFNQDLRIATTLTYKQILSRLQSCGRRLLDSLSISSPYSVVADTKIQKMRHLLKQYNDQIIRINEDYDARLPVIKGFHLVAPSDILVSS